MNLLSRNGKKKIKGRNSKEITRIEMVGWEHCSDPSIRERQRRIRTYRVFKSFNPYYNKGWNFLIIKIVTSVSRSNFPILGLTLVLFEITNKLLITTVSNYSSKLLLHNLHQLSAHHTL